MGAAEASDYIVPFAILFSLGAASAAIWASRTRNPVAIGATVLLALAALFMFTR